MHDGVQKSIILIGQSFCHYNVAIVPGLVI